MASKNESRYWTSIKAGDYVTLSDLQSFAEAGAGGVDYSVREVRRVGIRDQDSDRVIAEYHLHELERADGPSSLLVVVKSAEDFELRVYFLPQGFMTGTRDQLIDAGQTWFFLPPPDPEDFISSDLEYAPYPDVPEMEEEGKSIKRDFQPFGFGKSIYGVYEHGREMIPVIITEYYTEDETVLNNLILILEERWIRPDGTVPEEGGLITPLLGCRIEPESAEVYPS